MYLERLSPDVLAVPKGPLNFAALAAVGSTCCEKCGPTAAIVNKFNERVHRGNGPSALCRSSLHLLFVATVGSTLCQKMDSKHCSVDTNLQLCLTHGMTVGHPAATLVKPMLFSHFSSSMGFSLHPHHVLRRPPAAFNFKTNGIPQLC